MSRLRETPPPLDTSALLDALATVRIGVVGDLAADVYVAGLTERISREAPVPILLYESQWTHLGCAANTAANAQALGASVHLVGLLGEDEAGRDLWNQLTASGIDLGGVVRSSQVHTITKTRFLAGARSTSRQQVLRLDREPSVAPPEPLRIVLRSRMQELDDRVDAWIVSDYGCQVIDEDMKRLLRTIAQRKPVLVDSRYAMLSFAGVTVVKPNEEEAIAATSAQDGSVEQMTLAARELTERLAVKTVLITLGNQGMLLAEAGRDPVHLPASGSDEIVDLTGAGDTVAATFTLALAAGADGRTAAELANRAAGLAVMKEGPATVTRDELRAALDGQCIATPESAG